MTLLTIFIPTYNRRPALVASLERLTPSMLSINACSSVVNIVVSDNASDDGTSDALAGFKQFSWFTYLRQVKNIGFNGQLHFITSIALGDYVWVLGDDDLVTVSIDYIVMLLRKFQTPLYLPILASELNLGSNNYLTPRSFEDALNSVKGQFQFISSWIVPSAPYCYWIKVAHSLALDDPQCLANLGVVYDQGITIVNKNSIAPQPSVKGYQINPSTLKNDVNIFWLRPRAGLDALAARRIISFKKLSAYRRWEDKRLLAMLLICMRNNPAAVTRDVIVTCSSVSNSFFVRFLMLVLSCFAVHSYSLASSYYFLKRVFFGSSLRP